MRFKRKFKKRLKKRKRSKNINKKKKKNPKIINSKKIKLRKKIPMLQTIKKNKRKKKRLRTLWRRGRNLAPKKRVQKRKWEKERRRIHLNKLIKNELSHFYN